MSLAVATLPTTTLQSELTWCLTQARAPIVRPMGQWCEEEIIVPNGPFAGERYRHSRHPVSKLWFDAVDSGRWSRFAATGPTQNGKTFQCYALPLLYHVFEIGETTIIGLPSMDMANDKWQQDFLPIIEASNYRDLLPLKGEGSKGGQVKRSITFRNGAMLRFMTAGGSDKKRAGFTARVVGITETDGMDEAGEGSREADKIEQIEGRTRAFGRTGKRVYLECTVSIERGRIWQEIKQGTDSRIARPCPHCRSWVSPEREHLMGWQSAVSEEEAAAKSHFVCPECKKPWTEVQRTKAAERAKLLHRGQTVGPRGKVLGDAPATQTLGFRWSAIDNPFTSAGELGAEEWRAKRSKDRENSEKKMRQFVWAVPYEPPDVDITPLDPDDIADRHSGFKQGIIPDDAVGIAVGVDTGKRKLHWDAKAVRPDGSMVVIEYGSPKVDAEKLGVFKGLLEAFRLLQTYLEKGWSTADGRRLGPTQVWIDSGYHEHTNAVYALCAEANAGLPNGSERYRPTKGYGEGQRNSTRYQAPKGKSDDVRFIGTEFHITRVRRGKKIVPGVWLVHINSDFWKSEMHQKLSMPSDQPGAINLFDTADPTAHADYAAQLTAERQMEKFIPSRGTVTVWDRTARANHFLDAGYSATAAGNFILDVLARRTAAAASPRPSLSQLANSNSRK